MSKKLELIERTENLAKIVDSIVGYHQATLVRRDDGLWDTHLPATTFYRVNGEPYVFPPAES